MPIKCLFLSILISYVHSCVLTTPPSILRSPLVALGAPILPQASKQFPSTLSLDRLISRKTKQNCLRNDKKKKQFCFEHWGLDINNENKNHLNCVTYSSSHTRKNPYKLIIRYILLFHALEVQVLLSLLYHCFKVIRIIVMSLNIAGMKRTEIVSTFRILDYMDTIQMIELERMFPFMSKTTSELKISDLNCRRSLFTFCSFSSLQITIQFSVQNSKEFATNSQEIYR